MEPLISIITVVFNGEKHLEKTILSVTNQTYKKIEHIIVDGASKDQTLGIIKKHESKITKWISEPDNGIYDAMNKGLAMATGNYVWFINAGDVIFSNETLEKMLKKAPQENVDVFYGKTLDVKENGEEVGMRRLKSPETLTWKSFSMGMVVCHQSILIKKEICSSYNLNYKISADIDWIINALKKSNCIVNTQLVLSKFQHGGLSRNNIQKALMERFKIMIHYYGFFPTLLNHFIIGTKFFVFVLRNRRF